MADLSDDQNLPSASDVSVVFDDDDVPEAEREDILKEIETLVSESRTTKPMAEEYLRPKRSGIVFPIVINLVAAIAIAAGIYFISEYFRVREDSIALESRDYFSAEAQLIEEILRESEQRLAQKDQEIGQIQSQLALLDQEKQDLENNLQDQVAAREAELRATLDAELAAERARLADLGQSEEDINARLQEIEADRQADFASQIETFRAEAQAELDQLAAELSARESQLEQTLEASQEERTRIAEEAATREAELREELGAEIEALEEAGQEAQARIAELQTLREEEALLADRVLGSFAVIVNDIQEGQSDAALSGLDSLERLLRSQTPADSESRRRRQTEQALTSTLRGLVQEVDVLRENIAIRDLTTSEEEEAALEQQRAAELITTAAGVVQLAEDARAAGRMNEARSFYQQALSTIPSLEKVYPGILDLEATRRQMVMESTISEAQSLLAAGSSEAAITMYLEALRTISNSDTDPLNDVAVGILSATEQNQRELLDAQQAVEDELNAEIAAGDRQINNLNGELLDSRNLLAARDASITDLRSRVNTLTQQLATRQQSLTDRTSELDAALERVTELEDEIAALQIDLRTAQARSTSLQASLQTARDRIATLEESEAALSSTEAQLEASEASLRAAQESLQDQIDELTGERSTLQQQVASLQQSASAAAGQAETLRARVTSLEQELASRPEAAASDEPSAATQAEIDALNASIAQLNSTVSRNQATIAEHLATIDGNTRTIGDLNARVSDLDSTIARRDETIATLNEQLETARSDLRTAENARNTAQTDLDTARQQVAGLRQQITDLRAQRDSASGETSGLETEVSRLTEEVAVLQAYRDRVLELTNRYDDAQAAAVRLAAAGNYDRARDRLLAPLRTDTANEILPGLVTTVDEIYSGLISDAENLTAGEVRAAAFADVTGLTEQVKKNIDDPQGSAAVESYLRREPDIEAVANEIFEIIELASRDLSAAEVQYRLLGSVSRKTGNLVVVERLVALEPQVGDTVEIRRTPELGQEIPVALGEIIEVTDRRVVVSVNQIYQLDIEPQLSDIVYLAEK